MHRPGVRSLVSDYLSAREGACTVAWSLVSDNTSARGAPLVADYRSASGHTAMREWALVSDNISARGAPTGD